MALQIERAPWKRIGVGRTKFDEDYVLKDEGQSISSLARTLAEFAAAGVDWRSHVRIFL